MVSIFSFGGDDISALTSKDDKSRRYILGKFLLLFSQQKGNVDFTSSTWLFAAHCLATVRDDDRPFADK